MTAIDNRAAAMLAEREQHQPAIGCRYGTSRMEGAAFGSSTDEQVEAGIKGGVGEIGERGGRLRRAPLARRLGERRE